MSEITETALFVPAPSTVRGAATKLGASPDGKLISYGARPPRPVHRVELTRLDPRCWEERSHPPDRRVGTVAALWPPGQRHCCQDLTRRRLLRRVGRRERQLQGYDYVTVAGCWRRGADRGAVAVWDTTGSVSTPKLEAKPIARINDIAWDAEGKRLVLVGDGRAGFGATFSLDTGASIGEVRGHALLMWGRGLC